MLTWWLALAATALLSQTVQNPAFDKKLQGLLNFNTDLVSIDDIINNYQEYVFLDAREPHEYNVSHIPQALLIGYNQWNPRVLQQIPKDQKIIVYCSVGYRSEKITKKLVALGYSNVSNLYGSIFEWVNCNLPLEDNAGAPTQQLHTYNRQWSRWVSNPSISIQY